MHSLNPKIRLETMQVVICVLHPVTDEGRFRDSWSNIALSLKMLAEKREKGLLRRQAGVRDISRKCTEMASFADGNSQSLKQ